MIWLKPFWYLLQLCSNWYSASQAMSRKMILYLGKAHQNRLLLKHRSVSARQNLRHKPSNFLGRGLQWGPPKHWSWWHHLCIFSKFWKTPIARSKKSHSHRQGWIKSQKEIKLFQCDLFLANPAVVGCYLVSEFHVPITVQQAIFYSAF